jgi:small subunit ribosomal protein S21
MAFVKVDEQEPLEKSIKRFKRMVEKEGIIREWKKREYYEKPSTILNRKNKANARKQLKKVRKCTLPRVIETTTSLQRLVFFSSHPLHWIFSLTF